MAKIKFVRNSAGIGAILRSTDFGQLALAERIASNIRAQNPGADVTVASAVTDRLRGEVRVSNLSQARDGSLTRGAAASGHEVRSK